MKYVNLITICLLFVSLGLMYAKLNEVRNERDVLSDAIRNYADNNANSDLMNTANFYLECINKDTTNLNNWAYAY